MGLSSSTAKIELYAARRAKRDRRSTPYFFFDFPCGACGFLSRGEYFFSSSL